MAKKKSKQKTASNLLIQRAKKIGLSDEQIATYPDAESLKRKCDEISPRTNPDAQPKRGKIPAPAKYDDSLPDVIEFDSKLEAKFITANRAQFDEASLKDKLMFLNRKYGPCEPVSIEKVVDRKPVDGITKHKLAAKFLVTHYKLIMR